MFLTNCQVTVVELDTNGSVATSAMPARTDGRPHTSRTTGGPHNKIEHGVFTPRAPHARPLTARIHPPDYNTDLERGSTPRHKRLTIAADAALAQAMNTHRSSMCQQSTAATPRPDNDSADPRRSGRLFPGKEAPDPKEMKRQARRHIRMVSGRGDHIEREQAVNELCEMLHSHYVTRAWLVDQDNLVENLVALAQMGTPEQKDGTAVLLCLLADGSSSVKEAIVRVPKTIPALLRLLRGSSDVQRVNAAATVWFLAANEEFRTAVLPHGEMFELLVNCIDQGTSPQSEHASGALRMLAFDNQSNALSTLQAERLPEILLSAVKSESPGESLQAVSLMAQLSSFESISLQFRSHFASLDDSLECLLRILARSSKHGASIEIRLQAAVCLRNLMSLPQVCELSRAIAELVPVSIACFTSSEGMLRIRILGALRTMAGDKLMKKAIVRLQNRQL